MHPINKKFFGQYGIAAYVNNGAGTPACYIVKQLSPIHFRVTVDGTTFIDATLVTDSDNDASYLPNYGTMTIIVINPEDNFEYVASISNKKLITIDGNEYVWALDAAPTASGAYIPSYDGLNNVPQAPTLSVVAPYLTSVELSWTPGLGLNQFYDVQYAAYGTGSWNDFGTVTGTTVRVDGLSPTTRYDFQVAGGNNANGNGPFSNIVNATTT
jgi:hypothetical protein